MGLWPRGILCVGLKGTMVTSFEGAAVAPEPGVLSGWPQHPELGSDGFTAGPSCTCDNCLLLQSSVHVSESHCPYCRIDARESHLT